LLEQLLPLWSIRIALVLMFGAFALLLKTPDQPSDVDPEGADESLQQDMSMSPAAENYLEGARNAWLLGSFFSLLHAIATMVFVHQGSHGVAMEHIADKTNALIGIGFGFGLYFNYAFVLLWLGDALWWIAQPKSYEARSPIVNWVVYGFMIFIAFNGSVVFAAGWTRWLSMVGFAVLVWLYVGRSRSRRVAK